MYQEQVLRRSSCPPVYCPDCSGIGVHSIVAWRPVGIEQKAYNNSHALQNSDYTRAQNAVWKGTNTAKNIQEDVETYRFK